MVILCFCSFVSKDCSFELLPGVAFCWHHSLFTVTEIIWRNATWTYSAHKLWYWTVDSLQWYVVSSLPCYTNGGFCWGYWSRLSRPSKSANRVMFHQSSSSHGQEFDPFPSFLIPRLYFFYLSRETSSAYCVSVRVVANWKSLLKSAHSKGLENKQSKLYKRELLTVSYSNPF